MSSIKRTYFAAQGTTLVSGTLNNVCYIYQYLLSQYLIMLLFV